MIKIPSEWFDVNNSSEAVTDYLPCDDDEYYASPHDYDCNEAGYVHRDDCRWCVGRVR